MNYETSIAAHEGDLDWDGARAQKKRNMLIGLAIAVLVLAMVAYYFSNSKKATSAAPDAAAKSAPSVTVIVPGRQTVSSMVNATGTLAARREMPVGAAGEGGVVSQVWVEPGSWVKAGQVLASVERSVQIQQSSQLAAQISAAQADARLAQNELARAQALAGRGFISKAEIDRKSAQRDAANARVRIAQAQLNENRARIGRLDIRAPAAGLVLTRAVEPGQVIGAGSGVLFRIAKGGEMELRAAMSETDLARMTKGLGATVTPVGLTKSFNGSIWQVAPIIDPQTRQGIARIALSYAEELRPGGFASAAIVSGLMDVPLLPESAVLSDEKGNYVFVVGPDSKVERRDVKVASITERGAAISAGLTGSEKVVKSAGGFLNAGEAIKPVLERKQG